MWKHRRKRQMTCEKESEHLVELKGVCKFYNEGQPNEVHALEDITLNIDYGEFVCFLGQSGSGKSTLMNILGCLDQPTYGTYLLNGTPIEEIAPTVLSGIRNKEIGFIFQSFNLISTLSALENVELPLNYRGMGRREMYALAADALTEVGLEDRMLHMPNELSGGQQQRVAIARAMAAKPPIIMADEPTGNLDSRTSEEIMQRLVRLNEEQGTTIILITHNEHQATLAKRVITVSDGHVVSDVINHKGEE